jgi:hypothetical protein
MGPHLSRILPLRQVYLGQAQINYSQSSIQVWTFGSAALPLLD